MTPIDLGSRTVVGRDVDKGPEFAKLLHREAIDPGEVLRMAIHTALGPVFHYIAHLPWLQAKPQQLGAVGGIGVKSKALHMLRSDIIIGLALISRFLGKTVARSCLALLFSTRQENNPHSHNDDA